MKFLRSLFTSKKLPHPAEGREHVYIATNLRGLVQARVIHDNGIHIAKMEGGMMELLHADGRVGNWNSWHWY